MPRVSPNVWHQLQIVIKRFKFEELEAAVLPVFPETSWNRLRSTLMKHHDNFTVKNALYIIQQTIADAALDDKDLRNRLASLELIALGRNHKRKTWYSHELRGSAIQIGFLTNREIQDKVTDKFLLNNLRVDARVMTHDSVTFVSIMKRITKSKTSVKTTPTFFAFFQGQRHFFCAQKNIAQDYLLALAQSLGYTHTRPAKLSGKDLKSLMRMLWSKKQGASSSENMFQPHIFPQCKPVVRSTGIDFTEHNQKNNFMDKCLGENPPTIELLVVNGANPKWKIVKTERTIETGSGDVRWELRSHNVPNMLKTLVGRRVIGIPPPIYVTNLVTLGKNELTLRSQGARL